MRGDISVTEPCGMCDAGCYAYGAVAKGASIFDGFASFAGAFEKAPMCKTRKGVVCQGAVDFLLGVDFPVDKRRIIAAIAGDDV